MESTVRVSRSEWEAFLADHSRLVQMYELLLDQLDHAREELQRLRAKEETQRAGSQVTSFNEPTTAAAFEPGIIPSSTQMETQRCSYCQREMPLSARFCDGCGRMATLRCVCGHQLDRIDNFCTACGRAVTRG